VNYRLRGLRVRADGDVERCETSVCVKVDMKRIGLVKDDCIEIAGRVTTSGDCPILLSAVVRV